MLDRLTSTLDFHGNALVLRAERQRVLAGNIANADTPGFQARDMSFAAALEQATGYRAPGTGPTGAGAQGAGAGRAALSPTAAGSGAGAMPAALGPAATDPRHLRGQGGIGGPTALLYRTPEQASGDRNTVDMDRERANFADNAVRYEATLRFVNGSVRQTLSAIRGD